MIGDETRPAPVPDAIRRRREVAVAGHIGDHATVLAALDDGDATIRATALRALGRLDRLDEATLEVSAADADATVRRATAECIGRLGPRATTSTADDDPAVRLDVVLGALLGDRAAAVVEMAAWAAGERWGLDAEARPVPVPDRVLAQLVAVARHADDALVREAAVAALGAIGHREGVAAVVEAMHGPAVLRRRAVLALAAFDDQAAVEALEAALTDRDWQVRQAAEDLLDRRPEPGG